MRTGLKGYSYSYAILMPYGSQSGFVRRLEALKLPSGGAITPLARFKVVLIYIQFVGGLSFVFHFLGQVAETFIILRF